MANIIFLRSGDKEKNNDKKGKLEINLREKDKRDREAKKGLDFGENYTSNVAMFFF
jgi:hypothetical protein